MGLYTTCNDPRADQEIQISLDVIVDGIMKLMGAHVDSIVLVGSFGRGEGGVIFANGCFRPVNDFDIFVIVRKTFLLARRKYGVKLQELVRDLAKKTIVKQIDICISHPFRFRFARNLVSDYEIRNGYKLLYGEIDLTQIMPRLPVEQLPILDGTIYFSNRGSGLLISGFCFKLGKTIPAKYRENFQIELDKAWMAMGDAYLLRKKQYHYSYVERYRRIKESRIDFDMPAGELVRAQYLKSAKRHLFPCFDWPGDEMMIQNWYQVRDTFGLFFLSFESERLKQSFENWTGYSIFVKKNMKVSFWDRVYVSVRYFLSTSILEGLRSQGRKNLSQQFLPFHCAIMPMLLFSLMPYAVDLKMVNRGRLMIGLPELEEKEKAWEKTVAEYLRIFHPDGIIHELLEEANI